MVRYSQKKVNIMPPIGLLLGKLDFSNLFINLSGTAYATLAEAQKAGAATINYGAFINVVLNFLIVAFAMFVLVRGINRMRRAEHEAEPEPESKDCPHCCSSIPVQATRCPQCTSELAAA